MSVWWRGVQLDQRSADMMDEVARLCPGVLIDPTQGGYNSGGVAASAGTHDLGGAIDIAASSLPQHQRDELCLAMRRVGWAAWIRTPAQGFSWHLHGIAGGCRDLSEGAKDQWADYIGGRNGLASGAPDDGPRDFDHVGIMWEEYQARQQQQRRRRRDMILISRKSDGAIHLLGLSGPAHIGDTATVHELAAALVDPTHIAVVDDYTFDQLRGA